MNGESGSYHSCLWDIVSIWWTHLWNLRNLYPIRLRSYSMEKNGRSDRWMHTYTHSLFSLLFMVTCLYNILLSLWVQKWQFSTKNLWYFSDICSKDKFLVLAWILSLSLFLWVPQCMNWVKIKKCIPTQSHFSLY